jgi:hypothetical protein
MGQSCNRLILSATAVFAAGCVKQREAHDKGADYLYVWAGDADGADSDFLAAIDVKSSSPTFGEVIATAPAGVGAMMPHHTEYEYSGDGVLFANGWLAGRSFVFDLADPRAPKASAELSSGGAFSFPHSFARLPNGNRLATMQGEDAYGAPGGLAEFTSRGELVRAVSARAPGLPDEKIWPYSLLALPEKNRAVVTLAEMGMPPWQEFERTNHVQVWSLKDLRVIASVALPESGIGAHHLDPAEPRALGDGTVYVNTFTCGLYRVDGIESEAPKAEFVHAFPGGDGMHNQCFVPVVYGKYWIQTVPELPGLVVLDVGDPKAPVEVSRFKLDGRYHMPHWLAADRAGGRLVLTGNDVSWVLLLNFDEKTGTLSIDERFTEKGDVVPGIDFNRAVWPHGDAGAAVVHGAVFGK